MNLKHLSDSLYELITNYNIRSVRINYNSKVGKINIRHPQINKNLILIIPCRMIRYGHKKTLIDLLQKHLLRNEITSIEIMTEHCLCTYVAPDEIKDFTAFTILDFKFYISIKSINIVDKGVIKIGEPKMKILHINKAAYNGYTNIL